MAVLPIILYPDSPLRRKSKRVRNIDGSIQRLIDDMVETLHHARGVGLAAPQIGVPLRVVVIELPGEETLALVNPQIVKRSGERTVEEGCLSIPGYRGEIKRSAKVTAKGLERRGREVRIRGEGLMAQALEHEIDHLNGVLYVDYLESMEKLSKVEAEAEAPEI
ncbi:MAG: peptide deformylase [Dehalococcoidia bacterium]